VFFSDKGAAIGSLPTRDGNSLLAEMNDNQHSLRTSRRSEGAYGALERVQLSLRALGEIAEYESKRPGRKLLIWISPGWALLSGPNTRLTQKEENSIFRSVVGISDQLRQSRITLYTVDPLGANSGLMRASYYRDFLKPVKRPTQAQFANLALQVIATQTGGLVLNSSNDIASEIARCFTDSSIFYELRFASQPADGPDDFHALEIKIDKPGVTARTRFGYYAQPTPPQP
jgi:VWFA-related protein